MEVLLNITENARQRMNAVTAGSLAIQLIRCHNNEILYWKKGDY
jgi:hypothetical protein